MNKTIKLYIKRGAGLLVSVLTAGTITAYAGIGTVPLLPVSGYGENPVAGILNMQAESQNALVNPGNSADPGKAQDPSNPGSAQELADPGIVQDPANPGSAQNPADPGNAAVVPGNSAAADPGNSAAAAGAAYTPSGPGEEAAAYLGGAELTLLASTTTGQNMSFVFQTRNGSVIVIDGGLKEDTDHLVETIRAKGGRVSAWLITHPHSDHIGALTEILNRNPMPVEIDNIYYSFLERDTYQRGENMGRMGDYDNLVSALGNVPAEKLHTPLDKGQTIQVDDVTITVMNQPYRSLYNTFNNSSVGYRLDVNGRRILFLGDMGWDAGQNLLAKNKAEDLKADIVQMAHHGQDGVEEGVYRVIHPEICLWPTPAWLWDNVKDGQVGAGPWKTLTVRDWMESLGVKRHITGVSGDQVLR